MPANHEHNVRFSNRAENYAKYRPGYPKDLIDHLYASVGFSDASTIADLGSGTGILSRLLLERGTRVIGVEPNKEMRDKAERLLERYPGFLSINGTAEATGLPDNSIDHIICAQAFHWFDADMCKIEFSRILKGKGQVVLVWNRRVVEAGGFSAEYERLLKTYANDYNEVNHKLVTDGELAKFFKGGTYDKITFANEQLLDLASLQGRLLSSSYTPMPGEQSHDMMMEELGDIFNKHCVEGRIRIKYETECYIGGI